MAGQTRNIPQAKEPLVSEEEKEQARVYHDNSDSLYHAGINVGKPGFYDPQAGASKHAVKAVESEPKPILATDPGQPTGIKANVVSRKSNPSVDKSAQRVVSSGRKSTRAKDDDGKTS